MTTHVTSAREAVAAALRPLLADKIGGDNTEAYGVAMARALDRVEIDQDDLELLAADAASFYEGYVAALGKGE